MVGPNRDLVPVLNVSLRYILQTLQSYNKLMNFAHFTLQFFFDKFSSVIRYNIIHIINNYNIIIDVRNNYTMLCMYAPTFSSLFSA